MKSVSQQIKETIKTYDIYAEIYALNVENKLIQFQLNKFIQLLPKNATILDAGCGSGRDAKYFSEEKLNVIGIDLAKGMIEQAKKNNILVEKMDIKKMKFEKESFDGVWCMVSFSNIPKKDSKQVLKNFYNILKKEGIIYISTKHGEGENTILQEKYNNQPIFYSFYNQKELTKLIEDNGFEILESTTSPDSKWIEIFAKKI